VKPRKEEKKTPRRIAHLNVKQEEKKKTETKQKSNQ